MSNAAEQSSAGEEPAFEVPAVGSRQGVGASSDLGEQGSPAKLSAAKWESGRRDFLWRVHQLHIDWIKQVDNKAWIAISLQTALLLFIVNLAIEPDRPFGDLRGLALWLFRCSCTILAGAALAALVIVAPHMQRFTDMSSRRREAEHHLIYYGDLGHYNAEALHEALLKMDEDAELRMLSRQVETLSRIARRKHLQMQVSIICLVTGAAGLVITAAMR